MFLLGALFALCAVVHGQFNPSSNDYPLENGDDGPMTLEVAFKGKGEPWADLPVAGLVVAVNSPPSHFEQRSAVRASWAQLQSLTDPKLNRISVTDKASMVVRFVIGETDDPIMADLLKQESDKYHDIVRVPVKETIVTSMKKNGEFLKWAHVTYNYDWVFMCQDNSFVRIDKLLAELTKYGKEKVYFGKVVSDRPVLRSEDSVTPFRVYPPYVSEVGIALSHDLADFVVSNIDQLAYPIAAPSGAGIAMGNWFSGTTISPINTDRIHTDYEGCDKNMLVQGNVMPAVMKETFINLVKGVPCHANPFRPVSTVEQPQVLLSLKEGGDEAEVDNMNMPTNHAERDEEEEEEEQQEVALMNSNQNEGSFLEKMNAGADGAAVAVDDNVIEMASKFHM